MKLKVPAPKKAAAIIGYYFAILFLLALLALIIIKVVSYPPCSVVVGQHECLIDGWTVAGLAAAILAVAATLLAILGAVAVAAWWTNLDDKVNRRVDQRVEEQVQTRVNQMLEDQERKLDEKTVQLLEKRQKAFDEQVKTIGMRADYLDNRTTQLQEQQKTLLLGVMRQDPWTLQSWADIVYIEYYQSEIALHMAIRYMEVVAGFFNDLNEVNKHKEYLKNRGAPVTDSPVLYWEMADSWYQRVKDRGNADHEREARRHMDKYQTRIKEWKMNHPG